MSSVPEGWYVDPSTGTNLRWWSGSTWTDEVAPLPYEPTHSGPVDLFGAVADEPVADEPAADEPATDAPATDQQPTTELDPEVELTQLTRRELRARRGSEIIPDDAPKHLPPVTSVAAAPVAEWQEPLEQLDIPASPLEQAVDEPESDPGRRTRIVRMSVLLGILAVVSSVAVLTAGTV